MREIYFRTLEEKTQNVVKLIRRFGGLLAKELGQDVFGGMLHRFKKYLDSLNWRVSRLYNSHSFKIAKTYTQIKFAIRKIIIPFTQILICLWSRLNLWCDSPSPQPERSSIDSSLSDSNSAKTAIMSPVPLLILRWRSASILLNDQTDRERESGHNPWRQQLSLRKQSLLHQLRRWASVE